MRTLRPDSTFSGHLRFGNQSPTPDVKSPEHAVPEASDRPEVDGPDSVMLVMMLAEKVAGR